MTPRRVRVAALAVLAVALVALLVDGLGTQLFIDLTVAGLTLGSIAALSGVGVVVTYRATGIFNFAHGALAVLVAYVLWQLTQQWGIPVVLAAPLALLVVGPAIGVLLERVVFRPLSERDASTAESLVATIGLFVVVLGLITVAWGPGLKTNPVELFPSTAVCLGACAEQASGLAVRFGLDQLGVLLVLIASAGGLFWLFGRSRLGLDFKAVVDRRELAQLTAVDANRVSSLAWALGAGFAGLGGVLLAPVATGSLDPFRLTLLVIETFAVAVLARLTSVPRAIGAGLVLGLASSYLTTFSFAYLVEWARTVLDVVVPGSLPDVSGLAGTAATAADTLLTSILVLVLFGALLFQRDLGADSPDDSGSFVARVSVAGRATSPLAPSNAVTILLVSTAAVALPFLVRGDLGLMRNAHAMLALAVVFLSIVVVTGFSGHITLAQAAFAGIGALTAARLDALDVPILLGVLAGGLVCIPVGLAAGYPALRRRGLFLGLTTLALGLVVERAVLQNLYVTGNASANTFSRPTPFGLDLSGDVAFYFYELAVVVGMVLLARNLRRSQLGRVLGAMRDSEIGARSIGLNLRVHKLFVFCTGSFMAGIGGAMLSQARGAYSGVDFITINSLLWFAVVVVAGVGSIYGALLGAFLFTLLGSLVGEAGLSTLVIGLAAVSLGRLPGGLVGGIKRLALSGPAVAVGPRSSPATTPAEPAPLRPSLLAEQRLSMAGEERAMSLPWGRIERVGHPAGRGQGDGRRAMAGEETE